MVVKMARRMAELRASEIREILKLTQRPEVISFAGGLPAAETFPAEDLIGVTARVLSEDGPQALQYSPTEGFPPLRQEIADRMNCKLGTTVGASEILITSGSQQGLDFTGKILLDPDDVVLCESPTYLGAINAFKAYEPRFVEIDTDDDGMVISDLERRLDEISNVRFIYVIPDFQNPSGRTWSLERRMGLMELARRFEIPVIEDSPYAEVRFEGQAIPPLKSLEGNEWVVFLGTFSKVFCPGLRIGWLSAAPELFQKYVFVKQAADLHTSTLGQMQLAGYLDTYGLDRNIQGVIDLYRKRRDVMLHAMEAEFPDGITWTRPEGGMFLWVTLPEHLNARELLEQCLKEDVAFVPGGPFFPNGGHENTLRMNYSTSNAERIEEGVKRMAKVLRLAMA
ncbi:MAG: PLP-dependent aminotransferase family protein [Acidobacteria bacterium]|nr:PLP-dependent aminotransferase family protein [Acidobacteriota bacterium]